MSPAPLRILEIGDQSLMRLGYPDTTEHWSTAPLGPPVMGPDDHVVTGRALPRLLRRLSDPSLDLIVVQPGVYPPWSRQWLVRSLFRRSVLHGNIPFFRPFGQELLRARIAAPLAVWDFEDQPLVHSHNSFLLDRATLYFKRELPPDHWRVFLGSRWHRITAARFRQNKRNRTRVAKLRPISLGMPPDWTALPEARPVPAAEKTADVFFTGRVHASSTVRERGMAEIEALRAKGFRIDIPDNNLPLGEYLARCARAWLVWAPEGYGWDCFRTYEAALCGSVPVLNRQTVERYRALQDGTHCFYYDIETGGLTQAIESALQDRDRLIEMGLAAREFALEHHTISALARYVAETTLTAAGRL